jgi:diguanylate cyclase (GGDEF)-like protein/PAS domain S-box-containing protein
MSAADSSSLFTTRSRIRLWLARNSQWLAWLVLSLGLITTLTVTWLSHRSVESEANTRFAAQADGLASLLRQRLVLQHTILQTGAALLEGVPSLDKSSWRALQHNLQLRNVTQSADALGYALWSKSEKTGLGATIIYAGEGDTVQAGQDLLSLKPLREVALQTYSTGRPALSQAWNANGRLRVTLFVPVYSQHDALNRPTGVMFSHIPIDALMMDFGGERVRDAAFVLSEEMGVQLMSGGYPAMASGRFIAQRNIAFLGQSWVMHLKSRQTFEAAVDDEKPILALIVGGLISWMMFSLILGLARTQQQAEALALKTTRDLAASETKLQELFNQAPLGIAMLDRDGKILDLNAQCVLRLGQSREQLVGLSMLTDHPDKTVQEALTQALKGQSARLESHHPPFGERERRFFDYYLQPVEIGASIDFVLMFIEDITARKIVEQRVDYLAHYDSLTGLANRNLMNDRLNQQIISSQRTSRRVGLLFMDLDRFKNINDSLGHSVGDQLLQSVAERLRRSVRRGDTIARLGGDEFLVIMSDLRQAEDAAYVAEKILQTMAAPHYINGHTLNISPSMGLSICPEDGTQAETLIKNADAAMYHAKARGRNNYQFYAVEMNSRSLETLSMESSLRNAMNNFEFLLYYQPQFCVKTGQIVGTEALIRWRHPELGMVPPSKFIPIAEERGLIIAIGQWALEEACRQNMAWQAAGLLPMRVAVNLSALQFRQKDLRQSVAHALALTGMAPDMLELEITESSIMGDIERDIATLEALHKMGVHLAVDDFGTGYSSLSYLKRFPIDKLKIDQSFVRDITSDTDDAAITVAIISMAKSLGIRVIAEGVETQQQLDFLRKHACEEAQGYFLGRPLPPNEITALLARNGSQHEAPQSLAD